jgi:hypothetical protein
MAADMEIQARQAIRPTRVFTRAELKNCADLDRECWKQLGDFAETYARALLAGVWLALECESQEAWSASVLTGVKLDKLARERVAAELAEAGKTTREIAAATGVSQPTAIADVQAARDKNLTTTHRPGSRRPGAGTAGARPG